MREVVILGVGMHPFGKFLDKHIKDLGRVAVWNALRDAGVGPRDIQTAYVGNSLAGLITGQEGIRGQVILRDAGFGGIPITNVENACASSATALRGAWLEVASGVCDIALALGVEKMFCGDTARSIAALSADSDIDLARMGMQFSGLYAMELRRYMHDSGATKEQFAKVVVKNSYNGSLNPYAQHQKPLTIEEVLNSRLVADPLTLFMCASMGDGAAAAVLCSRETARKYTSKSLVKVSAIALRSGMFRRRDDTTTPDTVVLTAREAYEKAGLGPEDVDVAEVHDAMAPAELIIYEELGFCGFGEGHRMIEEGRTRIGGDKPVNTSGGLASRGHPVGATGLAQIAELVWQLRDEAGKRQVKDAKVALAQNQGGLADGDAAASSVTILEKC